MTPRTRDEKIALGLVALIASQMVYSLTKSRMMSAGVMAMERMMFG